MIDLLKKNPGMMLTLVLLAISVYAIVAARSWPFNVRLFPWVTAGVLFVATGLQFVSEVRRGRRNGPQTEETGQVMDFRVGQGMDPDVSRRRATVMLLWIVGFVFGIWLVGFHLAVPLLVLLYMRYQGQERWWRCVLAALITAGLFWGVFDKGLNLPFPKPHLFWLNQYLN